MQNLRQLLPSANRLIVFEAAGRLQSFTAAGRELGMSQAAVSYAIRGLEEQLGVELFRREHRKVTLNTSGARFYVDVRTGLSHIQKSAEALKITAAESHVTLAASTAFASFWMMPRLQRFRDELPQIDLRIQTSERDLDLITEGIALGIRGGVREEWPEYEALALGDEEVIIVASPSYRDKHGFPLNEGELSSHRLIHLEEPFRKAVSWNDWFDYFGATHYSDPRGLHINDYALVIQAAMEGQGIALGWRHLTAHLIKTGLLERVGADVMKTGRGFYVVWHKELELSKPATLVRDWLTSGKTL